MITTHLPIFNLKRGIRVNEYVTIEELDHFLGAGTALKFANEWISTLLSSRARTLICHEIETTGFPRNESEEPQQFVKRWMVQNHFVLDHLQTIVDKIEPLTYTSNRAKPIKPSKEILERARIIFDNQSQNKWRDSLAKDGIDILTFTGQREADIAILASGLKQYNDEQMEREFV